MGVDPEDTVELLGGVEKRKIVIVDHDPGWARKFANERSKITQALGRRARRIEHIGSTAVPGLAAKPIIDIDLSVDNVDEEAAYLPPLLAAGYQLRVRQHGHRMVRTPTKNVHVHICTEGSEYTSAPKVATGNDETCCSATGSGPTPATESATPRSNANWLNKTGRT